MNLGIQIEVSPGNALSTTASVETALGKVEAAGPRVGAAISKGLQQGSAAAERAKASAAGLSQQMEAMSGAAAPFKAIADAMQREQDMLQTIRGPMQQYMKDLETLDALLGKNKISTNEYAEQVTKLNARIGERPEPPEKHEKPEGLVNGSFAQALGGRFGEAGSLIGGLASEGTIEAGAVVGLAAELVHLGDEYTTLQNKALEFGGALGAVDQAIQSQLDLAGQLHGSLDETMELSIAVKERADDLGLSLQQQGQFARAFGEDIRLSGGSLPAASQALQQFILALESGQGAGRYMKTLMAEYPELAETLESQLGATTQQLIDLGNRGMLTPKMVAQAMLSAGDEIEAKFGHVGETTGQAMGHAMDQVKVKLGSSGFMGALHNEMVQFLDPAAYQQMEFAAADAERAMIEKSKPVIDQLNVMKGSIFDLDDVAAAIQKVSDTADKAHFVPPDYDTGAKKILEDYTLKYKQLNDELEQLSRVDLSKLTPLQRHDVNQRQNADASQIAAQSVDFGNEWLAIRQEAEKRFQGAEDLNEGLRRYQSGDHAMGISPSDYAEQMAKYLDPIKDIGKIDANNIELAKDKLAALAEATKAGGVNANYAKSEYESLMTTINGGRLPEVIKLFDELNDPVRDYREGMAAVQALWDSGKIDLDQYQHSLTEVTNAYNNYLKATQQGRWAKFNSGALNSAVVGMSADNGESTIDLGPSIRSASLSVEGSSLADKYGSDAQKQVEKYNEGLLELSHGLNTGAITGAQFDSMLGNLESQVLGTVDATDKFNLELARDKTLLDAGLMSSSAYATAVKKIGDEQRDARLAAGQGSIGDAFSSQFEKMAKDGGNAGQVMASTFGSAIGEMNTALESLVTGAQVSWSSIGQSFEKMLIDMGLKLAESQIFSWLGGALGGGAGSGLSNTQALGTLETGSIGAIGSYIGGLFANGGDVAIPHAAFGYSGYVGGTGGTDSKLFAAMVTPGEHVSIRRPEDVARDQRASSQAPQVHVIVPDNKRALLKTAASADGQRQVINTITRNRSALRGLLK